MKTLDWGALPKDLSFQVHVFPSALHYHQFGKRDEGKNWLFLRNGSWGNSEQTLPADWGRLSCTSPGSWGLRVKSWHAFPGRAGSERQLSPVVFWFHGKEIQVCKAVFWKFSPETVNLLKWNFPEQFLAMCVGADLHLLPFQLDTQTPTPKSGLGCLITSSIFVSVRWHLRQDEYLLSLRVCFRKPWGSWHSLRSIFLYCSLCKKKAEVCW